MRLLRRAALSGLRADIPQRYASEGELVLTEIIAATFC